MTTPLYLWLVEAEEALVRMIKGVFRFITEYLPKWIYHFIVDTVGPVIARLIRVLGLACIWLSIVFGSFIFGGMCGLPSWWNVVSVAWLGLAIAGSIWGLKYLAKRRKAGLS